MDGRPQAEVHGDEGRRGAQADPRVADGRCSRRWPSGRPSSPPTSTRPRPRRRSSSSTSGPILTKVNVTAAGLTPNVPAALQWTSVRRQPRQLHRARAGTSSTRQLGSAQVGADGTLKTQITVPDGLGGWHAVQVVQNGQVKAQTPLLREAELRLDPEDRQGRRAVHRRDQGRRLDAARQHRRRHVRQQLHRLRLRLQQQRLRADPADRRPASRART